MLNLPWQARLVTLASLDFDEGIFMFRSNVYDICEYLSAFQVRNDGG